MGNPIPMETAGAVQAAGGTQAWVGVGIFLVAYFFISTEKVNKTVAALLGAVLFIGLHIVHQEAAFQLVDWNVVFLLIGMMIIVGITKQTGVFQYVAIRAAKLAKGEPFRILVSLSVITALFSALLDNVTTVLILTPVTILIAVELGLSPVPFILATAMASNIGGTATLIGDPPNIMIGSAAKLSFADFIVNLAPIVLVILVLFCGLLWLLFGRTMRVTNERKARIMEFDERKSIGDRRLLVKSLVVLALVTVGFLLHGLFELEPATIALFGAALLMLLSGKEEIDHFFHEVEWGTIFFFIGLFILVGGLVRLGVIGSLAREMLALTGGDLAVSAIVILWASAIFSAFVDNIPFVATMIPLVHSLGSSMPDLAPLWWALALGACLGGNGTLIGASANVVSAGIAGKSGYRISFGQFTKYGMPVMLVSLAASTVYLLVFFL